VDGTWTMHGGNEELDDDSPWQFKAKLMVVIERLLGALACSSRSNGRRARSSLLHRT